GRTSPTGCPAAGRRAISALRSTLGTIRWCGSCARCRSRWSPPSTALPPEPLAAETAADWGLIWKAVDDARLIADAEALCAQFAAGPRFGLGLIKRALDAAEHNSLDAQLDLER